MVHEARRPRVVVTRRPLGDALTRLDEVGDVWSWDEDRPIPRDVLLREVEEAQALYCMLTDTIDAELLDAAPQLRAISQMAVGLDNVDLSACTARGIPVGYTPEVLTETTADLAFALLLAGARRLTEAADFVRDGRWERWRPDLLLGHDVHHSTLGIVGLGRIGYAVARRAVAFDMRVLYHNRGRNERAEADLGARRVDLEELLAESDHVVLLCPLTPETHHLIDADRLGRMKRTATLVNAARGGLVDLDALRDALRHGVIASAALDVTEPEPLPGDHPILRLDNCTVVPHIGSATVRCRTDMADLAADNLILGLRGEPMRECANSEVEGA